MLNYTCTFCGSPIRMSNGRMGGQCVRCGKYFSSDEIYRIALFREPKQRAVTVPKKLTPEKAAVLIPAFIFCMFAIPFSPLPMIALVLPVIVILSAKRLIEADQDEDAESSKPVAAGEKLKNVDDFIRAFRTMPLDYMPLREEAGRALAQLDALKRKQIALAAMLSPDHAFIKSGNEAAAYIMNNLKQVLYRLRFCDQSDPELRRMHTKFLRERLDENDRILRDFENLIIEVTQLADDTPVTAPSLDVLAKTLHSINTGEEIPPHCELSAPAENLCVRGDMK